MARKQKGNTASVVQTPTKAQLIEWEKKSARNNLGKGGQYSNFPLWLLEYATLKSMTGKQRNMTGPFVMHSVSYLTDIARIRGINSAVAEFDEQLANRICESETEKDAKNWLTELVAMFDRHASDELSKDVIAAINEHMVTEIEEAYADH